ncbi:hypothetical protein D3C74_352800 [compost metagenome]
MAEGAGIPAALVLTGRITLRQAAQFIQDRREPARDSSPLPEGLVKCAVVIPSGTVDQQSVEGLWPLIAESMVDALELTDYEHSLEAGDALLYCGSLRHRGSLPLDGIRGVHAICLPLEDDPAEHLLRAMAELYVLGVPFDPAGLSVPGGRTLPLPTYPFEYATYKASFEEEILLPQASGTPYVDPNSRKGLKKLEV